MTTSLKLAVAGLGTVGTGLLRLLEQQAALLEIRCSRRIEVTAVSARDRKRDRGVDLSGVTWFDSPETMARDADADVIVELIGGEYGVAKDVCEAAIASGRAVVTANKALVAHHGIWLARAAEEAGVTLNYEAAVAGGIPIVKALREGLSGNRVNRIYGILNGTCNYILSKMRESGREFSELLDEAQALGYAEADPSSDVDGSDTALKLAILTSLARGSEVDFDGVHVEGIRHVSAQDIAFADELGFRIKLLGIARQTVDGIEQRVHPCMVRLNSPIAHVEGVYNAVVADGEFVGTCVFEGRGAGADPTASAVVADLVDIARGARLPAFALPTSELTPSCTMPMDKHYGAYYVRLMVVDRPGVIADVSAVLRDEQVSMESMLQRGRAPGEPVPVVITTHETREASMARALSRIGELDSIVERPRMIRIESLES